MTGPRRWSRAHDIPTGVSVTARVYTSDSRMRWRRDDAGAFTQSYPGSPDVTVTAEEIDARVGAAGYEEVQP